MTLYELLQYADKELDIVIKEVSRAKALEDKMRLEAKKSNPKRINTIEEYLEYCRGGDEIPFGYYIAYDYIRDKITVVGGNFSCVNFNHELFFVDVEAILKFRDENEDELRWYFKEYKLL